jgi:ubiquinone/menaquinone biosynthesis C-methylase UbiE
VNDSLQNYYESAFSDKNGEIYGTWSKLDVAAHTRKLEILAAIDLPDLKDATVVDYGVGSWGFGCVFSRIKQCKYGIGIDVSPTAIAMSQKVSSSDPELRCKTVKYITSTGYDIDLRDESVDLIFCGECIEHIEETTAFLSELYRILKVGGTAVFTTPNASPWLYRQFNLRWCMGFEHVALMDYQTFRHELEKYFEIVDIKGSNHSLHPSIDWQLDDTFINRWAKKGYNNPEDATSMIATVKKTNPRLYKKQQVIISEAETLSTNTAAQSVELEQGISGVAVEIGNSFVIQVPAGMTRCQLVFWAHSWSGVAEIVNGDEVRHVDLYSPTAGCWRESFEVAGDKIIVRPSGSASEDSQGTQVILYRAVFGGDQKRRWRTL